MSSFNPSTESHVTPDRGHDGLSSWHWRTIATGTAFVLIVASVAHVLLSSHGFNPTDEGYYLSNARRILDGEVPHRDFISLRPAGAYFLFAPVVAIARDSALWIARFVVWVEIAVIAWVWAILVQRHLDRPFGRWQPVVASLLAFVFIAGWYPIDVSTTIEGYFFYTIGLACALAGSRVAKSAGYALMGYAYLCRQNLLFAGLISIVALGDWRHLRCWAAAALPGLLYVGWLASLGGLSAFFSQLTAASTNGSSPGGFFAIGVRHWLEQPLLWFGLLLGLLAGALLRRSRALPPGREEGVARLIGSLTVIGVAIGGSVFTLRYGHMARIPDFRWYSFVVAGLLAGLLAALSWGEAPQPTGWRLILCGLGMGWALSFSWAFSAPTLALGPLALLAVGLTVAYGRQSEREDARRLLVWGLGAMSVPTLLVFYMARQGQIGFDPPARQLTRRLDGVLAGARHLYTDADTYAYLVDFRAAIDRAPTPNVVVGPDLAAYWVAAPRPNPVSINWIYWGELINTALQQRVLRDLEAKRGSYTFIASKVMVPSLVSGFEPMPDRWSPVVAEVRQRFTKVGETRYFELYR